LGIGTVRDFGKNAVHKVGIRGIGSTSQRRGHVDCRMHRVSPHGVHCKRVEIVDVLRVALGRRIGVGHQRTSGCKRTSGACLLAARSCDIASNVECHSARPSPLLCVISH
jgi:hypothetical protein